MTTYIIDSSASQLVVAARSNIHDTNTKWSGLSGTIDADRDNLAATKATITVDMTTADAGDWLKNRKLRKDMDFNAHPKASFEVTKVTTGAKSSDAQLVVDVGGVLSWRGHEVPIEAKGKGTITETTLNATGTFDLDVTSFGVKAPKVLMFKIEDTVSCTVTLTARCKK